MAYPTNSLTDGTTTHTFIALTGPVILARESTMLIARPNVQGVDTMILAKKGTPFALTSLSSHATDTAANQKYKDYTAFISAGLLTLTRNGVNYFTQYAQKAKVLEVNLLDVQVSSIMAGNITTGDKYMLTCNWTLVMEIP